MSRQYSRDVSSLEVILNGSQIEIEPIGNGTKTIDDVKVMLVKGEKGDKGDPGDPANMDVIAPTFSASDSYSVGDYVIYEDTMYKCITNHSGAWDATDFRETTVAEELESGEEETAEYRYQIVTKSTGNYDASITVKKYINEVLDTSTDYLYSALQTPVNFDGHFTIGYANTRYTFTLLDNSTTHATGYTQQWMYNASVDFSETFVVDTRDISYIAPAFATSVSYAVGDLVTHEGKLYKCTTAHTGAWNASHFTETDVDACLDEKLPNTTTYAGSSSVGGSANSVGHDLYIDLNQHSVGFNGYSEHTFRVLCIYAEISANNWSATVDSDGYYTNTVTLSQAFSTYTMLFISCCGALGATDDPTSAQKASYNLVDKFVFPDNLSSTNEMTVKAKTKPTDTFYVLVNGHKLT